MNNKLLKESVPVGEPLGASEFAATLNGDNSQTILSVLKRFTKQVQRERRLALSLGDDDKESISDDDSSASGEGSDGEGTPGQQQPPTKKFKKSEDWKEDTQSYDVPFVGTAVARGDIAQVIPGQWPTGLLHHYLSKSPMAVELTGDDWIPSVESPIHKVLLRRKQGRLSRAIYRAYLKTLVELITAVIPIRKLRDGASAEEDNDVTMENTEDDADEGLEIFDKFLPNLLKKRLVGVLHLLNSETDRGRGKQGIHGGCGDLAPSALRFLQNVSMTSIANARLVCRCMDEELPEGVLRALTRPPPLLKNQDNTKAKAPTKPARGEAIRLATMLLMTKDSAVATYICTGGNRERKIKPGILFGALREGLAKYPQANDIDDTDEDYLDNVADMLEFCRGFLGDPQRSRVVGHKLLFELLSRDSLHHLCEFSKHAPPLSADRSFQQVLSGTDGPEDEELDALANAGNEARRFLYILLASHQQSPLLRDTTSHYQVQSLVKILLRMLQDSGSGIQTRQFLVYCIETSPSLLPALFRTLSIPDPKKEYPFMSLVNFVSRLMNTGPHPLLSLEAQTSQTNFSEITIEEILSTVLPAKLRRQSLSKAMQSTNPLVVLECLRVMHNALGRFRLLRTSIEEKWKERDVDLVGLDSAFVQWLPDLQVLLAIRSRYDPFIGSKRNSLVGQNLHLVLETYASVLPATIRASAFDWMKLLPEPKAFLKAVPLVQRRILSSLGQIIQLCQDIPNNFVYSSRTVLEIMLRTKDHGVHSQCRDIATNLVRFLVESSCSDSESREHLKLEASWWVETLTVESLDSFCRLLKDLSDDSLGLLGSVGSSIPSSGGTGKLSFSVLLMAALAYGDGTGPFALLAIQVATRSIFLQRDPITLAQFILSLELNTAETPCALNTTMGKSLVAYSATLVNWENADDAKRLNSAKDLLIKTFSAANSLRNLVDRIVSSDSVTIESTININSQQEAIELGRFCIHLRILCGTLEHGPARCMATLRRIIPDLLLLSNPDELNTLVAHIIMDIYSLDRDLDCLSSDFVLSSCPSPTLKEDFSADSEHTALLANSSSSNVLALHSSRFSFLRLSLLARPPSCNLLLKVQLGLFQDAISQSQVSSHLVKLVKLFCKQIQEKSCDYDFDVLGDLFDVWWSFTDPEANKSVVESFDGLQDYFAGLLASVLRTNTLQSIFLVSKLNKKRADLILERCFTTASCDRSKNGLGAADFLDSLVECDPLRYIPPFLATFGQDHFLESRPWQAGTFDRATRRMVCHPYFSEAETVLVAATVTTILSRVSATLENLHLSEASEILQLANEALISQSVSVELDVVSSVVCDKLCQILQSKELLRNGSVEDLCRLATTFVARGGKEWQQQPVSKVRLSTALFCTLLDLLLLNYKSSPEENNGSSSRLPAVFNLLNTALDSEAEFDMDVLRSTKPSILGKVCRNALKHGIHDLTTNTDLAAESLKLVRTIIRHHSQNSFLRGHFDDLAPADIFAMCTSHSKFSSMMNREKSFEKLEEDRIELVRLLFCCLKMAPDSTAIGQELWAAMFAAFDAGVDKFDNAVHAFFYLCCSSQSDKIYLPFMDELRWKGHTENVAQDGRRWDWFLDALDTNRIRETVSFFPVEDTLGSNVDTLEKTSSDMSDADVENEATETSETEESTGLEQVDNDVAGHGSASDGRPGQAQYGATRNEVPDTRYSPAFILTMALGALDSCIEEPAGNDAEHGLGGRMENDDKESQRYSSAFMPMAKRLIDKGVPALCLASLASRCSKVRTLSVSVLGLLLNASTSNEARALVSWRDRPQVALILNSIQRAFTLKSAKDFLKANFVVPLLPTLVSTFLARAFLSISKPDDALYVPLNRFFLKSDIGHGAFQDMNRLPAFISLFCSSNEDALQARKERIWALQLIRDGFLDPSCYRLIASCHAPELLLTSFENIRLSSFSDEMKGFEQCLILESITAFIKQGGPGATLHLVGRMGILSWIASLSTRRSNEKVFLTTNSRVAVLDLICSAVQSASNNTRLRTPVLVQEICGVVGPTVEIALESDATGQKEFRVIKAACRTLVELCSGLNSFDTVDHIESVDTHSAGITVQHTVEFFRHVPKDLLPETVASISFLPAKLNCNDGPKEECGALCSLLLEISGTEKRIPVEAILCRATLIANHVGGNFGSDITNARIVSLLLSNRCHFASTEKHALLWTECLEISSLCLSGGAIEAKLVAEILDLFVPEV